MSLDGRRSMSLGRVTAEVVTAEVAARPGDVAACTVRVRNDGPAPAALMVRVHGLGQSSPFVSVAGPPLPPGAEVDVEVPLQIPESFGVGVHSLAVEIGSGKAEDRSALAKVLLTIGAPAGITARIDPSVVRAGRRARFNVEVDNRNNVRTDVALRGTAPDVRVSLARRQITVEPGTTAVVEGRLRGPRRWVGDPVQHVVTLEADNGSAPIYATASYRQRALLPRRARGGIIGIAFIAVWALLAAAVVFVWARDDPKDASTSRTADGSLTPLTLPDGSPADGGAGSGEGSGSGGAGGGGGSGGDGTSAGSSAINATILRGTVKAGGTGADEGVLVTLTPTIPGESQQVQTGSVSAPIAGDPAAALVRVGPGESRRVVANPAARPDSSDTTPTKFWPDRYGTYRPAGLDNLRTLSVASVASDDDGAWQFQEVPLRQNYEVSFAKAGFTTQSFIVSPPDDGEPVELEVELQPGDGALGGVVSGMAGAAQVSVTDGTLTFETTTSTDARNRGRWDIESLSTPGTYTVTISSHGYGTEVMQVRLDPGGSRTDLNIGLRGDTGSISGAVTADGALRGGVTMTATSGDEEISTTSLTEGATGTYSFPQLTLGSTYTVTASADGYITQTRSVTVNGNETATDFALVKSTATIIGRVMSSRGGTTSPLVSATVSVAAGDLQVRTSSAAAPDAGAFTVTDLPPGTYVLAASRYDHPEVSQLVTLAAGQVFDAGDLVLGYETRPPLTATGSLVIRTFASDGSELPGATVQLIDVGGTIPTRSRTMSATEAAVSFTEIPIGTYTVRVTLANYRPGTIERLSIGLGAVERQLTMLQYGTARGTVIDAVAGHRFGGDQVFVTADEPSRSVEFGPLPIILPPAEQVGADAVAAYRTTHTPRPDPDDVVAPAGMLVVEYPGGLFVLDSNNDGVPDQPLTLLQVGARELSGYELLLYRVSGANAVCIGPIPTNGTEWEIDPSMALLAGSYVLRFGPLPGEGAGTACAGRGQAPAGFATIPTDANGNVASFTVADDLDRKILLGPISVAPYTQVSGRVLVPRVAGGTVVFDNFAAAQANGLTVALDCDAAGTTLADIGPGPGTAITFAFSRTQIQTALGGAPYDATSGLIGNCTLQASYSDPSEFIPTETVLQVGVGLSPAAGYPDRVVSVALVDDPGTITGAVWWTDLGATGAEPPAHAIPGALVASTDAVIVGFTPSVEDDPSDPDTTQAPTVDPGTTRADVAATTDGGGAFAFAQTGQRQVLDAADYRVSATSAYGPAFTPLGLLDPDDPDPGDPGSQVYPPMEITAVPGSWSATAVPDQVVPNSGGNSVDVFLDPPPGSITGGASITTTRDARPYGELRLLPTAPDGSAAATVTPDGASGAWSIGSAAAGTWELHWTNIPTSNLLITSPDPTRQFVDAGQPVVAPTVEAVELAQIDVAITDDIGNPIDGNPDDAATTDDTTVTVTMQPGPATQPAAYPPASAVTCGTATDPACGDLGTTSFARLPVSAGSPLFEGITYLVSADVPKHDAPTTRVFLTRVQPDGTVGAEEELVDYAGTLTDVPVTVRAGEQVRLRFATPGYARIEGQLTGRTSPPSWWGTPTTEPLVIGAGAQVVATRDNGDQHQAVAVGSDGSFAIDVPAGTYTISYSATNYVSPAGQPFALGTLEPDTTTTPAGNPVLQQQLLLQTGRYELTARSSTIAAAPAVDGATVQLWWGGDVNPLALPPGGPVYAESTSAGGQVVLAAYPGDYTLIVRKQGPDGDEHFPVIARITIPRAPAPSGSDTVHRVAMPPVGGSISGTVTAVATSSNRAVPLPGGLAVQRHYDLGQLGGPGVLPNEATEGDLVSPTEPGQPATTLPLTEPAPGAGATYEFRRLVYGDHELTFPVLGGYALEPSSYTVTVGGPEVHDVEYKALDVTVDVAVTDALSGNPIPQDDVTITLTGTESGQSTPVGPTSVGGVHRFTVAPDLAQYTLHVEADGYADLPDRLITVSPSGVTQLESAALSPVAAIVGEARTQGTSSAPYAGAVDLLDAGGDVVATATSSSTGAFRFEIAAADADAAYTVRLDVAGHVSIEAVIAAGDLILRDELDVGVLIALQHATATISVSTTPVPAGLSLAVSSNLGGDVIGGAGASTTGTWSLTALKPGAQYSFTITADDYEDYTSLAAYTATPGGHHQPSAVALVPLPASVSITVDATPPVAGLTLTVTSSVTNDPVAGDRSPTGGTSWVLSGFTPGAEYSFVISADDYEDYEGLPDFTATPNGSYVQTGVQLTPRPATATISAASVTPAATGVALTVLVGGVPASGLSGTGGSGPWTVTGLTPGTEYTFRITSNNYTAADVVYTFGANETHAFGAQAMSPMPATATVTVGGAAGTLAATTVTCSSGIVGTRGGPTSPTWTFTIPASQSCVFTAASVGYDSASSPSYTATPGGSHAVTLTPTLTPPPPTTTTAPTTTP